MESGTSTGTERPRASRVLFELARPLARALFGPGLAGRIERARQRRRQLRQIAGMLDGRYPRECPICGHSGLFHAFGDPPRYDAQCPQCGSLERHRLLRLALNQHPAPAGSSVLHFAPEAAVRQMLGDVAYQSADLVPGRADLTLNLEAIDLPSQSQDVVIASHVLEHVDDRLALREILRILRPGGALICMVPIIEGWDVSYEDRSKQTEAEREMHFGQNDHVRYYGRDFRDRVRAAGFELTEFGADGGDTARYGLIRGDRVFFAVRPA